jgi:hypothetical protein
MNHQGEVAEKAPYTLDLPDGSFIDAVKATCTFTQLQASKSCRPGYLQSDLGGPGDFEIIIGKINLFEGGD